MNQVTDAETADSAWKGLYRVGATTALIMVVVFFPNPDHRLRHGSDTYHSDRLVHATSEQ